MTEIQVNVLVLHITGEITRDSVYLLFCIVLHVTRDIAGDSIYLLYFV